MIIEFKNSYFLMIDKYKQRFLALKGKMVKLN